jgi:transposase
MKYCGFDCGKKSSQFCIVNENREVLEERRIKTDEKTLRKVFHLRARMRIVIEASTKSFWIADILESCGHDVRVVDPRKTKAIGAGLIKHDKLDARVLATLCQADIAAPVHRPTLAQRHDRMSVVVRDALVRSRTELINCVRSLLDSEGISVPTSGTEHFTNIVRELPGGLPEAIAMAIEPMLSSIEALNDSIDDAGNAIKAIAASDPVMRRFQGVDGVGPIVAASFVNAIREPGRFKSARQVGAYLGLVPSLYQSGDTHRKGSITKHGNRQARYAMTLAANALLRSKRDSDLKRWGLALVKTSGRKKAIVALARKLAGVLWAMWKKNTFFVPTLRRAPEAA